MSGHLKARHCNAQVPLVNQAALLIIIIFGFITLKDINQNLTQVPSQNSLLPGSLQKLKMRKVTIKKPQTKQQKETATKRVATVLSTSPENCAIFDSPLHFAKLWQSC